MGLWPLYFPQIGCQSELVHFDEYQLLNDDLIQLTYMKSKTQIPYDQYHIWQ